MQALVRPSGFKRTGLGPETQPEVFLLMMSAMFLSSCLIILIILLSAFNSVIKITTEIENRLVHLLYEISRKG